MIATGRSGLDARTGTSLVPESRTPAGRGIWRKWSRTGPQLTTRNSRATIYEGDRFLIESA